MHEKERIFYLDYRQRHHTLAGARSIHSAHRCGRHRFVDLQGKPSTKHASSPLNKVLDDDGVGIVSERYVQGSDTLAKAGANLLRMSAVASLQ